MTNERDQFIFALALVLMVLIALLLLAVVGMLYMNWQQDSLQPVCSDKTGAAMWFYDGKYSRDLSTLEKRKWCPAWTTTPTSTFPAVWQTPYNYYNNSAGN